MFLTNREPSSGPLMRGRTLTKTLWLCFVLPALLLCLSSCKERPSRNTPAPPRARELEFDTTTAYVSTCGNRLLATGYNVISVWEWSDLDQAPQRAAIDDSWEPLWLKSTTGPHPVNDSYTLLAPGRLIHASHRKDDTSIIAQDIHSNQELNRWSLGRRWNCRQLRSSRNGKILVILLMENDEFVYKDKYEAPGHRRKGSREDYGRYRLGIVREASDEIQWVTTIWQRLRFLPKVSQSAVSEDGKYLAGVGTNNGGFIHLADVAQKKVLWEKVPRGEEVPLSDWTVNFRDVCFSPDSKYVYVAANIGLLCFDLSTGKILSQWRMTGLCTRVDVSPDGRLVAGAGEGSELVYVFHAKTGKVLLKLRTGQLSVCGLTFSPDSTLLATSGVRHTNVKIWKMPLVGSEKAPQAAEPNESKQ